MIQGGKLKSSIFIHFYLFSLFIHYFINRNEGKIIKIYEKEWKRMKVKFQEYIFKKKINLWFSVEAVKIISVITVPNS